MEMMDENNPDRLFMLYHPEYAPAGEIFDMTKQSLETLAEQGWVDSPAKAGYNPWGPQADAKVAQIKRQYDQGLIPGIELTRGDLNKLLHDNQDLERRLRETQDENMRLKRETHAKEAEEREARQDPETKRLLMEEAEDAESDAEKKMYKGLGGENVKLAEINKRNEAQTQARLDEKDAADADPEDPEDGTDLSGLPQTPQGTEQTAGETAL